MDTLLLRNKLFLKVTVVVCFIAFEVHPTVSQYQIFDITRHVNHETGNHPTIKVPFSSSSNDLNIQFFYKTDLTLPEFFDKEYRTVSAFLDQQRKNHDSASRRAKLILEFPVTDEECLKDIKHYKNITEMAETISVIVMNVENMIGPELAIVFAKNIWSLSNNSFLLGIRYEILSPGFYLREILPQVNISLVAISLNTSSFVPSHGMFKSLWRKNSRENFGLTNNHSTTTMIYQIQLEVSNENNFSRAGNAQVFQRYQRFIASTSAQLATEEKGYFIIEPFTTNTGELTVAGGTALNQSDFIIPILLDIFSETADIVDYMESGRRVFNTIYVAENDYWDMLLYCLMITKHMNEEYPCKHRSRLYKGLEKNKLNVILHVKNPHKFFKNDTWNKTDSTGFLNVQTLGVFNFFPNAIEYVTDSLAQWQSLGERRTVFCETFHMIRLEHNDRGMYFNYPNLSKSCKHIMKTTNLLIWNIHAISGELVGETVALFFNLLELLDIARLQLKKEHPGKQVIFKFTFGHIMVRPDSGKSLYCESTTLAENSFFESIGNWAALRKVRVILKPLIGNMGWMSKASIPASLNESPETVNLLVRNYPSSVSSWLGKSDPCIEKTESIPESGIILNENFTGVSFNFASFQNTSFTVEILETMLHFVLHKFSRVVIPVGDGIENVKNLKTAFVQVLEEVGKNKRDYSKLSEVCIQVEFTIGKFPSAEFYESVQELVKAIKKDESIAIVGIHGIFNDKEIKMDQILRQIRANVKSANSIGIGFEDCIPVLNNILEESNSNTGHQLLLHANYVVCLNHVSFIRAGKFYSDQMAELLDGHLVIRNAFKRIFPHLTQVHFQLLPNNVSRDDMLKLYSDVAKYSEVYEVSHFLGTAFDDFQNQEKGWWRLDNDKDLANTYSYADLEMEHLGKPTWRPVKNSKTSDSVSILLWAVFAGIIVFLVMTAVIAYRMGRNRVLTEEEVREFLQGKKITEEGMELCPRNDFSATGFNKEYEIPKVHNALESCTILGMGNFGIVVKTTVRDETVALKIPNDKCSKESFKSMLSEVKLLCYIGEHVNVIKFVGAYVKEISNGVIQIATVLCENGSLEGYLRGKQSGCSNDENRRNVTEADLLRELIHFAKEIATGMAYIGSKNVVHGDLATRNVLLDGNNTCKIADFGLSRKLYEYNKYVKKSQEPLPWRWMAYESLKRMEFTRMSDMWSFGVTLWEIFSLGDVPYSGLNWTVGFVEEICNGLRMNKPQFSTPEIFERMSPCWNLEPETRPTFEVMKRFFVEMTNSDYHILNEV